MNENIFDKLDFGPFRSLLDDDDITDISYDNNGQIWIRSLTQGSMRVEIEGATPEFVEKLAFQCSNVMGTTFNNAKPFLDAESAELRMNFVHQSIATNGIALVIRKTPAKIRLEKEKLIKEDYFTPTIHDFLIKCVQGHCNIMVAGETGSGKTEFVKYLASHTATNEKIITIEDTLELHLDKIYPQRDIVAMKTNNVASYSDVLVTCMRQNPKWILLSEVRSAEAVSAVRNSISSGHNILSTIHADKASAIPYRLYSLMETDLDVHQFLTTIYRYIQLGVHIKAFYSKEYGKFHRELDEVCEFYVDDNNVPQSRIIYQKLMGKMMMCKPSEHLVNYLENQNIDVQEIIQNLPDELPLCEVKNDDIVSDTDKNENTKENSVSNENVITNSDASNVKSEGQNVISPLPENTNINSQIVDNSNNSNQSVVSDNSVVAQQTISNNGIFGPTVSNGVMNTSNSVISVTQGNVDATNDVKPQNSVFPIPSSMPTQTLSNVPIQPSVQTHDISQTQANVQNAVGVTGGQVNSQSLMTSSQASVPAAVGNMPVQQPVANMNQVIIPPVVSAPQGFENMTNSQPISRLDV